MLGKKQGQREYDKYSVLSSKSKHYVIVSDEMRKYLRETSFKDSTDLIIPVFEKAGITDYKSLQNAPVKVGHIGKIDIYQLVAELNEVIPVVDQREESEAKEEKPEKRGRKVLVIEETKEEEKGEEVK